LKRVALLIQYDGSYFSGWQRQKNAISVQGIIEDALYKVSNQKIKILLQVEQMLEFMHLAK